MTSVHLKTGEEPSPQSNAHQKLVSVFTVILLGKCSSAHAYCY